MRPIFLITVTLLASHQFITACKKNQPSGVEVLISRLQSKGSGNSADIAPPDKFTQIPLKLQQGTTQTSSWNSSTLCKSPGAVYGVASKEATIPFEYRTCLPEQQYAAITVATSLVKTTELYGMLATYTEAGKSLFLNLMLTVMPDGIIFLSCEGPPTDKPGDKISGSMLLMKNALETSLSQALCNNHVYFLNKDDPTELVVIFPTDRMTKVKLPRLN